MNIEQKQNKIIRPKSIYTMSAEEQNQITSELQNLIAEGGLTPSENDLTQVKNAVKNIADQSAAAIGARTVTTLGTITQTTALDTNTNYTATLNGSAAFTLPTPSDTSIENTINILLTVSVNSTVDWGVNANSVLSSFAAGKYEIRLRYNNATSNWIGEVLKVEDVPTPVKLYVPFYKNVDGVITGAAEDLSNNPVSLSAINPNEYFPTYGDGKFTGTKAIYTRYNKGFSVSGDSKSKLNLGTSDFTLSFWIKSSNSGFEVYNEILYSSSSKYVQPNKIYYNNNTIISGSGPSADGNFHYVVYARHNNSLYRFVDGTRTTKTTYSGDIDFSDITRITTISSDWGSDKNAYVQEILLKNTCDYDDDTTTISVPTAPYVISDNSLSDLHDKSLAAKIADLEAEINNLKGAIMRRMDFANAVALTMSSGTYTMPSDGYLQLNYSPTTAQTYQFKLNNQNIYISNVSLMPVSKGDILGLNSTPFNGFFIPEKSN